MNKFKRIQLVRLLGLNTEESVLVEREEDWERQRGLFEGEDRLSIRTFRPGQLRDFGSPHFPIIESAGFDTMRERLLRAGLSLIVGRAIDPVDAEVAGTLLYEPERIVAEVAFGPGTVRRVTHEGRVDARITFESGVEGTPDLRIRRATAEAKRAVRGLGDLLDARLPQWLLFEFSWYSVPVGHQHSKLIFWEVLGPEEWESHTESKLSLLG